MELELEAGVVDAGLVLFTSDVEAESTVLFELDVESAGFFFELDEEGRFDDDVKVVFFGNTGFHGRFLTSLKRSGR